MTRSLSSRRSHLLLVAGLALTTATLAACGGDPVQPKPPAPPAVAKITYSTPSALLFVSHVAPVSALVQAWDSAGNQLPSSRLAISLPSGWTLRGDSIVAPSFERVGALRATPVPTSQLPHSEGVALFDSIAGLGDSSIVTAALDLRAYTWRLSWDCGYPRGAVYGDRGSVSVDSSHFDRVTVDSINYPTSGRWVPNYGGVAQLWWHGPIVRYYADAVVDTGTARDVATIGRQSPDTIHFSVGRNNPDAPRDQFGSADYWPAVKTLTSPLTYVGGTLCSGAGFSRMGPVTAVATPLTP